MFYFENPAQTIGRTSLRTVLRDWRLFITLPAYQQLLLIWILQYNYTSPTRHQTTLRAIIARPIKISTNCAGPGPGVLGNLFSNQNLNHLARKLERMVMRNWVQTVFHRICRNRYQTSFGVAAFLLSITLYTSFITCICFIKQYY